MIGLMVLLALAVYLAITVVVVKWAMHWARKTGRSAKRWGIIAGLAMYLLVFWDHIPTLVLHKYYCATKAGFWVYKTPEQWKTENPGMAETLTWRESSPQYTDPDGSWGLKVNERFIWENRKLNTPLLPVRLHTESVIDIKTGEAMLKRVSVSAGYTGEKELFRFWTSMEPCIPQSQEFGHYRNAFKQLGRETQ